ncbi:MAG TPA: ABC transporter permease, partial [Mycobacteriales bacterium]|nr:ABC transporter permease [Mycobacteriales bacterium]
SASVGEVVLAMGLSLFASIGVGFVISLASASDAQAVQYTLIVLLASLFFSGFFLSIGQLGGAAQWAGYLLPVTYGMNLLRDVMLRGADLDRTVTLQLLAYGVVMFALALWGTRRRMAVAR